MGQFEASEKIDGELLELLNVTYDDLILGDFIDDGEKYSCVIWIQDVDIEEAVEAGIAAAEKTRVGYTARSMYAYPYTISEVNNIKYVDVELGMEENDEYVQTYIEKERETATGSLSSTTTTKTYTMPVVSGETNTRIWGWTLYN